MSSDHYNIYKLDDGYVFSHYQVWVPGVYDSIEAIELAKQFDDEILQKLQDESGGVISLQQIECFLSDEW